MGIMLASCGVGWVGVGWVEGEKVGKIGKVEEVVVEQGRVENFRRNSEKESRRIKNAVEDRNYLKSIPFQFFITSNLRQPLWFTG